MTYKEALALSAVALNDKARQLYTDEVLIDYLNMALPELQEIFEQNSMPVTEETSALIDVPAGTTEVGFDTNPSLPANLKDIITLHESDDGLEVYSPMFRRDSLPPQNANNQLSSFGVWSWSNDRIKLYSLINDKDIVIQYIKSLFPFMKLADLEFDIDVVNASTFIFYRTAGLAAEFIGENPTRAASCNGMASLALDRSLGIGTKSKQSIVYRRRPFRASYRR